MSREPATRLSVIHRTIAGIAGGYVLANVSAVLLALILPMRQFDAVAVGLLSSFVIYSVAGLWVFTAPSVRSAWLGILLPTLLCWLLAARLAG